MVGGGKNVTSRGPKATMQLAARYKVQGHKTRRYEAYGDYEVVSTENIKACGMLVCMYGKYSSQPGGPKGAGGSDYQTAGLEKG